MKTFPVLILGMHRSGTSVLTDVLERAGLFVGSRKDQNSEAVLFLQLNKWMLMNANASWDDPCNFNFLNEYFINQQVRVCAQHLQGLSAVKYLGWTHFLKYRDIRKLDFPFGWKDPRNTFTVPIWQRIFPSLRLIHIYRHPADVAASLRAREERMKSMPKNTPSQRRAERTLRERVNYVRSLRVHDLREGVKLWKTYTQKAFSYNREFGDRILHIRFEDMIADSLANLPGIFDFAGLSYDEQTLRSTSALFDKSKIYSFASDPELSAFFQTVSNDEFISHLNYDKL